jgi:hypothetical protein
VEPASGSSVKATTPSKLSSSTFTSPFSSQHKGTSNKSKLGDTWQYSSATATKMRSNSHSMRERQEAPIALSMADSKSGDQNHDPNLRKLRRSLDKVRRTSQQEKELILSLVDSKMQIEDRLAILQSKKRDNNYVSADDAAPRICSTESSTIHMNDYSTGGIACDGTQVMPSLKPVYSSDAQGYSTTDKSWSTLSMPTGTNNIQLLVDRARELQTATEKAIANSAQLASLVDILTKRVTSTKNASVDREKAIEKLKFTKTNLVEKINEYDANNNRMEEEIEMIQNKSASIASKIEAVYKEQVQAEESNKKLLKEFEMLESIRNSQNSKPASKSNANGAAASEGRKVESSKLKKRGDQELGKPPVDVRELKKGPHGANSSSSNFVDRSNDSNGSSSGGNNSDRKGAEDASASVPRKADNRSHSNHSNHHHHGGASSTQSSNEVVVSEEQVEVTVKDLESEDMIMDSVESSFRISDEIIGKGAFGNVYMGLNIHTSELVAVKELRLDGMEVNSSEMQSKLSKMEDEISVMKDLKHPNIVRYLGTSRENRHLYIFLEFMPGGCIAKMLKRFGPFPEENVKNYLRQILNGLAYLHNNKIIHRDIKGGNILVKDAVVKLADFGCSIQFDGEVSVEQERLNRIHGSVPWMAPEMIRQSNPGRKADIWSLGCTVVEMLTGKRPWPEAENPTQLMYSVATKKKPPPIPCAILDSLSEECKSFLSACFQPKPENRWSADQLLAHPFLR